eukprot:TRINITY_DN3440_c0_g1_i1.p1 TRINITY_DN3440_c0_g1~~TRINITY_DN3440_c0_g1_i1.p1  ORF type:complete len:267 (+),score=120.06 TRINITY_DN3440_c0_g1_i1:210-1010(+)
MGNWFSFGRKRKDRVTQHDKAVLDLKVQRDKLKVYQKKCEAVIAREVELARQLLADGKRKQALLCLRKKRYQEQLIDKTATQLNNLQEMVDAVEFAQLEAKVFEGLKQGNAVLKEIQSQMSIEEVENLMLDTQEAVDYQNQVSTILAGQLTDLDEEAVEAEYEALRLQMEPAVAPAAKVSRHPKAVAEPSAEVEPAEAVPEPSSADTEPAEAVPEADELSTAEPAAVALELPDVPAAEPEEATPESPEPEQGQVRAKRAKPQPQLA